jgi:glycosyltransferase involved in cell wall biosynthesis
MKISVDLGASFGKGFFGTKIFSLNLKKALLKYDKNNQYFFYDEKTVWPKIFWMKLGVSLKEWQLKPDVFLALNQALPFYFHKKAIAFSHGFSFYFFPKCYPKNVFDRLNNQLKEMIKKADKIVISSKKVKDEFLLLFPKIEDKIYVLPFGIPFDCLKEKPRKTKEKFFLTISSSQPIKNFSFIKKTFFAFKKKNPDYKLINVENIRRKKLISLYQKATSFLTASYYESFNLPVLEALSLGCPVVGLESAIIPELRDYVNLAKDEDDFLRLMKEIPKKPTTFLIKKLKEEFSWKKYVKKLVELY